MTNLPEEDLHLACAELSQTKAIVSALKGVAATIKRNTREAKKFFEAADKHIQAQWDSINTASGAYEKGEKEAERSG